MDHEDDEATEFAEQDQMDESFDQLRLHATKLRMQGEQGRQYGSEIDTGNPELNAVVRETLAGLIDSANQAANNIDETVDHFHPLYREDKRAGRTESPPASEENP